VTHYGWKSDRRRFLPHWLLATILIACLAVSDGLSAARPPALVTPYVRTLLAQINLYRQDNGLQSLVLDPALTRAARTHSFSMFQQKRLSHLRFDQRFQQSNSRFCVENIGRGATNPLKQFDNWRRAGAHDQNMLVEEIRRAGIAEVGGFVTFFACQ
jgi:uncharacterized protein YkwD